MIKKKLLLRCLGRMQRFLGYKQLAWDNQFKEGIWGGDTRSPHVLDHVRDLCKGGRLVEIGCGFGELVRCIPRQAFSTYLGIDISAFAIQKAIELSAKQGLTECEFLVCDMPEWRGDSDVSLILLEECLYYIKGKKLEKFLKCCIESLATQGVILVIVHNAKKHARTLHACRKICKILKEENIGTRTYLTLTKSDP